MIEPTESDGDRLRREALKIMAPKKRKAKKSKTAKAPSRRKLTAKKKNRRRTGARKKASRTNRRGKANTAQLITYGRKGLGPATGGQAGDTQGLSSTVDVDSESVEELLEEGQSFEAQIVDGVENAPEPDQGEVRTRQVREDDVPEEYREND